MISDTNLINQFKDFEDTKKYSKIQFTAFINGNQCLRLFYEDSVEKFKEYQQKYPNLIKKFADNYFIESDWQRLFRQYSEEEKKIVNEILQNKLHIFYALSIADESNWYNLSCQSDLTDWYFCTMYLQDEAKLRPGLIDYIIKFCPERYQGINLSDNSTKRKQSAKEKFNLTDEEIQLLELRKTLTKNSYNEIGKNYNPILTENNIAQKFMNIKNKLGANSPDEAVSIYIMNS